MTEVIGEAATLARIRELNDQLRIRFVGGAVVCTPGILALPEAAKATILEAIRTFDRFTADNDPYGEHDFGTVELDGERVFFKIDYFNRELVAGSPDPADPAQTVRRQNIRHNSRRRLAECGPRQGVDVRRRTCGAASADVRWSVA